MATLRDDWRRLYEAALRFRDLAPWKWMEETDLFGVRPLSGEVGFVSVMGQIGEHFALAVYLGAEGLAGFWAVQDADPDEDARIILEVPQLQASYEPRQTLTDVDRRQMRDVGVRVRAAPYPQFRSIRPGYAPWYLEPSEVPMLTVALEQAVDVARRLDGDPLPLRLGSRSRMPFRVEVTAGGGSTWEDRDETVRIARGRDIPLLIDEAQIAMLDRLPRGEGALEADVFMFPGLVHERGKRPFYPYAVLVVDPRYGRILEVRLLEPVPSLNEMLGRVAVALMEVVTATGVLPRAIVTRARLAQLLQPIATRVGVEVDASGDFAALDEARQALEERFGR